MGYISVEQAAENWGLGKRRVQDLCKAGAIEGAQRFGRAWAIPEDAPRPPDLRTTAARTALAEQMAAPPSEPLRLAMPLLNSCFVPGQGAKAVENIEDEDSRAIARAELAYFSGRAAQAAELSEPYLASEDISLRLSACFIYAYASLAVDHIAGARLAMAQIKKTLAEMDENTSPRDRALAQSIATGAAILMHLPLPEDAPPLRQFLPMLAPGLRLFALYVQAHQAYLKGQYSTSIGIVETAMALEGEQYPISSIYLHLMATMDYMSLRQPQPAREHLLAAWELARPDDLIEPFGEHHGLLGGMLEAVIKKEWPEDFRRIIAITYSFSAGWRKIHNPATGRDVADDLTTTEFTVAMLAARDWSNKEISAHLGVSVNTVKLHISSALQKLGISQRKELEKYMLP